MSRRPSPVGPIVMIVPLLSLVAGALWMRSRVAPGAPPAAPAIDDPEAAVRGWRTVAREDPRVVAELFPLHADPERQAFEARALAGRLDLGPGEPWRLRLQIGADGPTIDPTTIAIEADGRAVLGVLEPGAAGPLAALLSPPSVWPSGRVVEIVLWGRPPESAARLTCRDPSGGALALDLETHQRPRRELPAFLARLDPAELRKESAAEASETAADGDPTER